VSVPWIKKLPDPKVRGARFVPTSVAFIVASNAKYWTLFSVFTVKIPLENPGMTGRTSPILIWGFEMLYDPAQFTLSVTTLSTTWYEACCVV